MNCQDFEHRLHELMDQRDALSDLAVQDHATECEECRDRLSAFCMIGSLFSTSGHGEAGFKEINLQHLDAETNSASEQFSYGHSNLFRLGLATCAALLVIVSLVWYMKPSGLYVATIGNAKFVSSSTFDEQVEPQPNQVIVSPNTRSISDVVETIATNSPNSDSPKITGVWFQWIDVARSLPEAEELWQRTATEAENSVTLSNSVRRGLEPMAQSLTTVWEAFAPDRSEQEA